MLSILIVEGEPSVRSALGGVLRNEGYEIDAVDNGEACLERLSRQAYDVVLLDIWLPGMDGLATLARMRERQIDVQVVIISGNGNIESAVRAIKMGAFDFVEKPLSLEKTVLVVRNALRQRRLETENGHLRVKVHARHQNVAAWREVARHLTNEIRNSLTPIQLCAERMQRQFAGAPAETRALVEDYTTTIVGEVESIKGLVGEFSQFARTPSLRAVPTDLNALLTDVIAFYRSIFSAVELHPRFAAALPKVSVDPEKIRRTLIHLIDNAVEAMAQRGAIDIETHHVPDRDLVRIVVADDGPGISPAERDKLFLPYYSTKQRGSGLGLAVVRRTVSEHGGNVKVTDNVPRGTRFVIELPC